MKIKLVLFFLCFIPLFVLGQKDSISLYEIPYWRVKTSFNNNLLINTLTYNSNNEINSIIEYRYDYSDTNNIVINDSVFWYFFFLSNNIDYSIFGTYETDIWIYDFTRKKKRVYEATRIGFETYEYPIEFHNDSLFNIFYTYEEIIFKNDSLIFYRYELYKNSKNGKIFQVIKGSCTYRKEDSYYISENTANLSDVPKYIDFKEDTMRTYYIYEDTNLNVLRFVIHYYYDNLIIKLYNYIIPGEDLSYPKFMDGKYDELILEFEYDFKKPK